MIKQGMHLRDLVRALGWSYSTLWSRPNVNTELVWADGSFEANPLKRYESEYFDVERLFTSSYKSCAFALGCGYVGKVLKEGQPLWLNGTGVLIHHSNSSSQAQFFKVAGIQTLLCIPWFDSVIELGSSSLVPQSPDLLDQIQSFLTHMAMSTSRQQITNACLPMDGSPVSEDLSAGSDDASFNGELSHEQQVQSYSSLAEISRSTQHRSAAAEHDLGHGEVVTGPGESDWRLQFASSELLNHKTYPHSPSSTLSKQRLEQEEELDFGSSFLTCPRQHMPLLSQLEYNQSISTSHSSSKGDDTNNFLSESNGNSEQHSDGDQYSPQKRNCNVLRRPTAAAGFTPWNATAPNSSMSGAHKLSSSHSNQFMLQRSISMTHKLSEMKADRERQRATEQITAVRQNSVSTADEVLSGHDDAAVNHMLAERRRRQKQKENFSSLRGLIPFVSKMDRASTLGDAISYVKQLTARVEELEFLNRELEAQLPGLHRKRSRSSITSL